MLIVILRHVIEYYTNFNVFNTDAAFVFFGFNLQYLLFYLKKILRTFSIISCQILLFFHLFTFCFFLLFFRKSRQIKFSIQNNRPLVLALIYVLFLHCLVREITDFAAFFLLFHGKTHIFAHFLLIGWNCFDVVVKQLLFFTITELPLYCN